MNKNKRIRYRHVHALRDLSRCFNFAGVKIKKGIFYRSGYLGKLSETQAKEFVETFNIGYIVDLRTDVEKENAPDLCCENIKYFHIPVLDNFDNPLITKENRNNILLDISKNKGGAVKYLERVYRKMVSDEQCLFKIKQVFDLILNKRDDKAIIFHCTQGKDRTGVLAALILYALGVDKKSIFIDYKRFNNSYRFRNLLISIAVAIRFFSCKVSKDLYYLQMAHKKLIRSTFEEINEHYQDRYDFFKKALSIDGDAINQMRRMYLVKE